MLQLLVCCTNDFDSHRPATSWVHYTTSCNKQSSAPEDGQNNFPKHVELTGIINKPLLLHLVGCIYFLYQWCTVKQISDNKIYLLIKYIKSVLWRVAKGLSYIQDARCLKVNGVTNIILQISVYNWHLISQRNNIPTTDTFDSNAIQINTISHLLTCYFKSTRPIIKLEKNIKY